jgi:hypothetical protein
LFNKCRNFDRKFVQEQNEKRIVAHNTSITIELDTIEKSESEIEDPVTTKCVKISWSLADENLGEKILHVIDDLLNTVLINLDQMKS